jgi:tol-pal system protein YbgF
MEIPVVRRALFTSSLVAVLGVPSAWAANKDIERLQIQIASLQGQMADMQRTAEDTLKEIKRLNEALAEQNAFLRRGVQDRRLQDEAISSTLKDLTDRMSELTERMQTAAAAPAPAVPAPVAGVPAVPGDPAQAAPPPAAAAPPAPRELYTQAYADYARGNFDLAIQEWQEYLRNYPDTDLSDNAQYWIGECLYSKGLFADSVEAWNELLRQFPSSDKVPDARYKKGLALERLGRRSAALVEYRFVADRFPNSEAGRKAREKLSPR